VVYAKRPFGGPEQVLAYLGRYTHRVVIANSRLIGMADGKVSFRWKDYRQEGRRKVMTLEAGEFMRRFLLHVLPPGFHRIRHFGFLANGHRAARLALCRRLLANTGANQSDDPDPIVEANAAALPSPSVVPDVCPSCGSLALIRSTLARAPPRSVPRQR
jgi:hypothetical protein